MNDVVKALSRRCYGNDSRLRFTETKGSAGENRLREEQSLENPPKQMGVGRKDTRQTELEGKTLFNGNEKEREKRKDRKYEKRRRRKEENERNRRDTGKREKDSFIFSHLN